MADSRVRNAAMVCVLRPCRKVNTKKARTVVANTRVGAVRITIMGYFVVECVAMQCHTTKKMDVQLVTIFH